MLITSFYLSALTNRHSQALPLTRLVHSLALFMFFGGGLFSLPNLSQVIEQKIKDYRLLSLAGRSKGSTMQQSPLLEDNVVQQSEQTGNG